MPVIACKLPAGIDIRHKNQRILLAGANIGEDLENPSKNDSPSDNRRRASGYGLTEITADQAAVFTDWCNQATYRDGDKAKGKLDNPFPALENGSILGPFKSFEEARKECDALASSIETGFEGADPKNFGLEESDESKSRKK